MVIITCIVKEITNKDFVNLLEMLYLLCQRFQSLQSYRLKSGSKNLNSKDDGSRGQGHRRKEDKREKEEGGVGEGGDKHKKQIMITIYLPFL